MVQNGHTFVPALHSSQSRVVLGRACHGAKVDPEVAELDSDSFWKGDLSDIP